MTAVNVKAGLGVTPASGDRPVVLEARNLSKTFRGFRALNGVSLSVREGSIHALIGPNGAGKTTLFNLLTKFLAPSSGAIIYRGRDITAIAPAQVAQLGLVRSFQISATFPNLPVLDNVRIALQRRHKLATQIWRANCCLSVLDDKAMELIDLVGLSAYASATAASLPYGRKRALELATTLALDPDVMLLDEPMAGMSHEDIGAISDLIASVAKNRTVLMVEHNLSVVQDLCDFVTVLERGTILVEGTYAEVSSNVQVREAYLGSEYE